MLLKPIQNRREHGPPLLCALRAPVSRKVSKRQVHKSELRVLIVAQHSGTGLVILPRNLGDLSRELGVYLDPLPSFLEVRRIASLLLIAFCAGVYLAYRACFRWSTCSARNEYCSKELMQCASPSGREGCLLLLTPSGPL